MTETKRKLLAEIDSTLSRGKISASVRSQLGNVREFLRYTNDAKLECYAAGMIYVVEHGQEEQKSK